MKRFRAKIYDNCKIYASEGNSALLPEDIGLQPPLQLG